MSTYFVTYTLKDSTDYTELSKRLKNILIGQNCLLALG